MPSNQRFEKRREYLSFTRSWKLSLTIGFAFLGGEALAASGGGGDLPYAKSPDEHFHPLGKPPTEHTLKVINKARETMPFHDTRDFEEAERGFIAAPESLTIDADGPHGMGR